MSLVFEQNSVRNQATVNKRWLHNRAQRMYSNRVEQYFLDSGFATNGSAALPIPDSVFSELDKTTKKVIEEPTTDVIYNDLIALSKPVDIGVLDFIDRRSSGTQGGVVSMSMSTEHVGDITAYNESKIIVPIFQDAAFRQPREVAAWRHAGFDVLLDDHENTVRNVRNLISDSFVNGAKADGKTAYGILTSPEIKEYKTKVDFTLDSTTGEQMRNGLLAALASHRKDSRVITPRTVYVSLEIDAQLDRKYIPTDAASRTIREELLALPYVKEIKPSALITGNMIVAGVLSTEFIRTIVGQEISSFSNVRQTPFDPFKWFVYAGVGLNVRADYDGRCGWCKITK